LRKNFDSEETSRKKSPQRKFVNREDYGKIYAIPEEPISRTTFLGTRRLIK